MISADLAELIQSLGSLWAIELLLLLRRNPERSWPVDDLVVELRSSRALVEGVLVRLNDRGLVERQADGASRYQTSSPAHADLVTELDNLYTERPLAITQALHGASN